VAASASVPSGVTLSEVESAMSNLAKVDAPMDKEEPMGDDMAEASVVKTDEFAGADSFHKGEGTATIYGLADGSQVLRMEAFNVTNGPDLHVIFTPHPDPGDRDDVHQTGYVDLGKLKGNMENQNYASRRASTQHRSARLSSTASPFTSYSASPESSSHPLRGAPPPRVAS